MTLIFVLMVAMLCYAMKLAALLRLRNGGSNWEFIVATVAAPNSLRRRNPIHAPIKLLGRALLFTGLVFTWEILCSIWIGRANPPGPVISYLGAPSIYFLGEALGPVVALLGRPFGRELPFVLNAPLRSRDLADFWGRRWNVWFSDWFRFVILEPMKRRPVVAVVVVFAVSGLMHEGVINLPLWFVTGHNLFGTQMLYFMIQAAGLLFDRQMLRKRGNRFRRVFAWLVVIGPLPLAFNEGMLRILHFWPV